MMNIYSRDRHLNLTSRSFDQSRNISVNESTYNYGRKREREITFLWKEHSRPFLWDPFVWWTINSRADTREIRYRQLVCRYGISLLPQCFCGGEEEQAAKRAARRELANPRPFPQHRWSRWKRRRANTPEWGNRSSMKLSPACSLRWAGRRARENRSIT